MLNCTTRQQQYQTTATVRQTYIQTDIHTDRHTYRQTDRERDNVSVKVLGITYVITSNFNLCCITIPETYIL